MTNSFSLVRSLITYGVCLALAILVGYLSANTATDFVSFLMVIALLGLLMVPLFLRWHYAWLLLAWNMDAVLFFVSGKPYLGWVMILVSFTISMLHYIIDRRAKFISTPSISRPLWFLLAVILVTAWLTGGIGLNALGSSDVGGKRYIQLILAVIGFFALTAVRIPPHKRRTYISLYFAGTLSLAVANLALVINPAFTFIFWVFPTDQAGVNALISSNADPEAITRLGGLSAASLSVIFLMLAFWGIRGFLIPGKSWRVLLLVGLIVATLFGGFRSQIITLLLTLGILFYMEGLFQSRLLPALALLFLLVAALTVVYARKLPMTVQRSLAFLPIDISQEAADNAAGSTDWRLKMWRAALDEVPKYLVLGKGLAINARDLQMQSTKINRLEEDYAGSMLAGDYHSGPLSLIIPFGMFGVAGFVWFLAAGIRALYRNHKFGDAGLATINRLLLAQFIVKTISYIFVFGSFYGDMLGFVGILGFSIALNHGVARRVAAPVVQRPALSRFRLVNAVR